MKRLRHVDGELDSVDIRILQILATDARIAMTDLARAVKLSAPSATERVKRLEERSVITGYAAMIEPAAVGLPLGVYIRVRPMPGELTRVAALLASKEEVVQCDRVTGDDCFVAKAFVANVEALERLIDDLLPYASTNTSLIQSSPVRSRPPCPSRSSKHP